MIVARQATVGMLGIDCVSVLSPADCNALAGLGVRYVGRYLGHISAVELDAILDSGLSLLCLGGYARGSDWSAQTGQSDASATIAAANALSLPEGITIILDLEGEGMTDDGAASYATSWTRAIQATGDVAGIYAGAGCPLNGAQLYSLPATCYMAPCTPYYAPVCGFQVVQLHPGDQQFAGLEVDFSIIQQDYLKRLPVLVSSG